MVSPVMLAGLALLAAPAEAKVALTPASVEQAFVVPEVATRLRWRVAPPDAGAAVDYVVRDIRGASIARGQAKRGPSAELAVEVRVPRGFFEIEFPGQHQRFGLVALPEWNGQTDPFFAIDGGLSWLVRDDSVRLGLIAAARRCGIAMVRERLSWGLVSPAHGRFDWETPARFETIRKTYEQFRLPILEMAHDAPPWMGRVKNYPDNLAEAADSWRRIGERWGPAWGAVELWNEPDIAFGGDLPGDQYTAQAKAVAYGVDQGGARVAVVGGVLANFHKRFLDTCANSGLLERVDAFSFHTYGPAAGMEALVGRYRGWLREHDRGAMPLWISECGRPWKRGSDRPPADQDAASALDITMKGVEARACGIARYFPFVYPFYDENENNFGMTDRSATPLRPLAAYAQLIRVLAGLSYLGDLKGEHPGLERARVFGDDRQAVAVLYSARVDPWAVIRLEGSTARIEGIDGRALALTSSGKVPIPDGLVYVWLDRGKLGRRLVTDTPARRLHPDGAAPSRRAPASPVVLRYQFNSDRVQASAKGYLLKSSDLHPLPLTVRAFNLSDRPVAVRLDPSVVPRPDALASSTTLTLPPRSSRDQAWTLDPAHLLDGEGRAIVTIRAFEGSTVRDDLTFVFEGEPDLELLRRQHPDAVRLPIEDPKRWTPNLGGGRMSIDSTPEAFWRLRVTQPGTGDHWVYPYFALPADLPMQRADALVLRVRCARPSTIRIFLWEGTTGVGYLTPDAIVPSDGRWHIAHVRFADLVLSGANAPDPNQHLDLDAVRRVSIGMNHAQDREYA